MSKLYVGDNDIIAVRVRPESGTSTVTVELHLECPPAEAGTGRRISLQRSPHVLDVLDGDVAIGSFMPGAADVAEFLVPHINKARDIADDFAEHVIDLTCEVDALRDELNSHRAIIDKLEAEARKLRADRDAAQAQLREREAVIKAQRAGRDSGQERLDADVHKSILGCVRTALGAEPGENIIKAAHAAQEDAAAHKAMCRRLAYLLNSEQNRDPDVLLIQVERVLAGRYAAAELRKGLVDALDLPPSISDYGLLCAAREMRRSWSPRPPGVTNPCPVPWLGRDNSLGGAHLDPRTPPDWE